MQSYFERNKMLRGINVLFFTIIGMLMIQSKYMYGMHFYFENIFIGIIILTFILIIFISSYYKKIGIYYQRNMFLLLWIITIFTTYAAYIGEYKAVGLIQILLLSICIFPIFNQHTLKLFILIYIVSTFPIIVLSKIGGINKIVVFLSVLGILWLSQIRLEYQKYIAIKLEKLSDEKSQMMNNAKEGFAIHEMIFDSKGNPIDYKYLDINTAFENMTGECRNKIINRTLLEIWPKTENFWIDFFGSVVINKEAKRTMNYSREIEKFFEVSAYPIEEKRFGVLFFDVTKRIENDRKLKFSCEKMEKTDQLKTKFLQDVNHRLRTPLNGMMGMMQLINIEQVGKDNQEIFEAMIIEMKNTRNVINQISQYTNIQHMECEYTKNNVKNIIETLVMPYKNLDFNILINIDESCEDEKVYLEENILNKVFKELINNAAKHTLNKRIGINIMCELEIKKSIYKIEIIDFGLGISKEEQKYIFNEFYHHDFLHIFIEETEVSVSMCKQMLEILGGNLIFESELGKGTVFTIIFPVYLTN